MVLFISNVASVVDHSGWFAIDRLAAGLGGTSALLNILGIPQSSDHAKWSFISWFIKGKSRNREISKICLNISMDQQLMSLMYHY